MFVEFDARFISSPSQLFCRNPGMDSEEWLKTRYAPVHKSVDFRMKLSGFMNVEGRCSRGSVCVCVLARVSQNRISRLCPLVFGFGHCRSELEADLETKS